MGAEVADYFHNILTGKTFVLEQGLRPDETRDGEMSVMIMERNWYDFTEQPGSGVIYVVKEFYANAREAERCVVQVQGQPVSYTRKTINAYYNLRDILEDDYMYYSIRHYDLDVVIRKLTKPHVDFKTKNR